MSPPPSPAAAPVVASAGTLTYTRSGLVSVFGWLLTADLVFTLIDVIEPRVLPVILKLHDATDTQIGAYAQLVFIVIAFPVGWLVDRRGSIPVLRWGLVVITLGYLYTFLFATGRTSFLAGSLVFGVAFWIVMMAQLKLTADVFHPQRYSQLAGANTIVPSIAIAVIFSYGVGKLLDALKGWSTTLGLPGADEVVIGPYRLVYLMMGLCYLAALFGVNRVQHHMRKLTGPDGYVAPL